MKPKPLPNTIVDLIRQLADESEPPRASRPEGDGYLTFFWPASYESKIDPLYDRVSELCRRHHELPFRRA